MRASCATCHAGPTFVDDYMHSVEFFDLVLQLGLSAQEKSDLVAYTLCL